MKNENEGLRVTIIELENEITVINF